MNAAHAEAAFWVLSALSVLLSARNDTGPGETLNSLQLSAAIN